MKKSLRDCGPGRGGGRSQKSGTRIGADGRIVSGSSGLEGADLVLGNMETLRELPDPAIRPARIRQLLPPQVTDHMPDRQFEFAQVLRSRNDDCRSFETRIGESVLHPFVLHIG